MTLPSLARPPLNLNQDSARWVIVGVLAASALITIMLIRQVTGPLDGLLTQQVCSAHGTEIGRPVIGYERSRPFALIGRSEGTCLYGPPVAVEGDDAEPDGTAVAVEDEPAAVGDLEIPLDEADPGGLYRASKVLAILLQLGAASAVVRFLADPLLDRFVRRPD
jgi:hypothetical protein